MLASPVQLKHYHLTHVDLEPLNAPDLTGDLLYPAFDDCDFSSEVDLHVAQNEANVFRVSLDLIGAPKENEKFPYRFRIGAEGLFLLSDDPVAQLHKDIALVNGAAILYSALRDILLGITLRMPNGPMMLPTVNFLDLREPPASDDQHSISTEPEKKAPKKRASRHK